MKVTSKSIFIAISLWITVVHITTDAKTTKIPSFIPGQESNLTTSSQQELNAAKQDIYPGAWDLIISPDFQGRFTSIRGKSGKQYKIKADKTGALNITVYAIN